MSKNKQDRKINKNSSKMTSLLLIMSMLAANLPLPSHAEGITCADYLDGWKVGCTWDDGSDAYVWEAKEDGSRQPKMVFTYRVENAKQAYPSGSICVEIPGIGNAVRESITKASKLPGGEENSEWSCSWDQLSDTYTFTNLFEVEEGQSVNGGFELSWDLEARDSEDGFSQKKSPVFRIEGSGSISLSPLSYQFSSVCDRYRIAMERGKIYTPDEMPGGEEYAWYEIKTRFDKDWLARGLYQSDYYITIELAEGEDYGDVLVRNSSDSGDIRLEQDGDGNWGFYPFKGRRGDVGDVDVTYYNSFSVGFLKESLKDDLVTIHGHFDRLYYDEKAWVTEAGENEKVDDEISFTASDYQFTHAGYIYDHDKWNKNYEYYNKKPDYYWYGYEDEKTHNEPENRSERLNAVNLYKGKAVEFTLRGEAKRNYASSYAASRVAAYNLASASDAETANEADAASAKTKNAKTKKAKAAEPDDGGFDPDLCSWNDIHWKENNDSSRSHELSGYTYGEIHPNFIGSSATDSDAYRDGEDEDEEDGGFTKWLIPDISFFDLLGSAMDHFFGVRAYAAETASPSGSSYDADAAGYALSETNNSSGISMIGEDQEYALIMGDDKLAIFLENGSIRDLEDEEYDIVYVRMPKNQANCDYEVYASDLQDKDFDEYILVGGGNTEDSQIIWMPEEVKAFFVRFNGITGNCEYYAHPGIRLHLDWSEEQEKEKGERPDHENRLADFSYMRVLYINDDGYEVNDCAVLEGEYGGSYGGELNERDKEVYGECLLRDYSNVWLRGSVTELGASASLADFEGGGKDGFVSVMNADAVIEAEDEGILERFSVYVLLPEGLLADFDNDPLTIRGSGTGASGEAIRDFQDYVTIEQREWNGRTLLAVDFDFAGNPLQADKRTAVNLSFPVSLSYADYISYGSQYTAYAYLMVHDDGLDEVSGTAIVGDEYDIDGDGMTTEQMAYAVTTKKADADASEWREYASKYVKSDYSDGYVTEAAVKLSKEGDAEAKQGSLYEYRLDFGLGSSNAKNIIFYDRIEQGASIAANEAEGVYQDIATQWQGSFVSVDVSFAESMGFASTVYYSEDPGQEFDLGASGWTDQMPENASDVRSIAVALDTSQLPDGIMKMKQMAYVIVNMQAPQDPMLVGKKAVNQYYVQYDAYGADWEYETAYMLPSSETYVQLLDSVGKIILQKVDADNRVGSDSGNNPRYASLYEGSYQVYDSAGNALFEEPEGLNSLGRLVVPNISQGVYYWEEIEAPPGYQKAEGRHQFSVDGVGEIIIMENHRLSGEVTLVKHDRDDEEKKLLPGAKYELYTANGDQIFTDRDYVFSENGNNGSFTTGEDGSFTVKGLSWGSYYFIEEEAPEGYERSDEKLAFTLGKEQYDSAEGRIHTELDVSNDQETASVLLKKEDASDGRAIKGAYYDLYRENEPGEEDVLVLSGLKTNAGGEILASGLKFGTYYFVETMNPGGYEMAAQAKTDSARLDEKTAGQVVSIYHTDERKEGSVCLYKQDDAGQEVGGAAYDLYYQPETGGKYQLVGNYVTSADSSSEEYGEIHVDGLAWGNYYFRETAAPQGYELSREQIEFTVDEDSVQNVIYLESVDLRLKGSVKLKKADKADPSRLLPGAAFELFRQDGTKCIAGVDYISPQNAGSAAAGTAESIITTGEDGCLTIYELEQGAYYLKEVTAPPSYDLCADYFRFSITKENASVLQELIVENERAKAVLTILKEINEVYEPFGNPTFIFRITRSDGKQYYKALTLSEQEHEGSVSLSLDQGFTYQVEEVTVSRYQEEEMEGLENAVADEENHCVVADLTTNQSAKAVFKNRNAQYEKFSDVTNVVNIIKKSSQLTAISVSYHGAAPITSKLPGYDAEEEMYTIPKTDLTVMAHYDNGRVEELSAGAYLLLPAAADGNSNSYTGMVSFTDGGVTRTASFSVEVELPEPTPRYAVDFELNGGRIVPEGESSSQESYTIQVKSGRAVSEPKNPPEKKGYRFMGWYEDAAFAKEATFPVTITEPATFYARWEQEPVYTKYAVSIYGIRSDRDKDGYLLGLTFGPATGEAYINSSKSHTPGSGQLCIHAMSWEEIIAQSKANPDVFTECMQNGCTHSVDLELLGPLAEGADSYQYMSGDGAGMLFCSLNPKYRAWNASDGESLDTAGGWPSSKIRLTLNGGGSISSGDSLLEMFPEELKEAISAKAVISDANDGGSESAGQAVTYDKLWLFSTKELFPDSDIHPEEGAGYERQLLMGISSENASRMRAYSEDSSAGSWWLRSVFSQSAACETGIEGNISSADISLAAGIAPGFCLPGPKPTTRYAVSLYGIKQDAYRESDGTLGVAGLTFGPAAGGDYTKSYQSHVPEGETADGNAHRCIHDDDWGLIIQWSQKDPYVYEQCYGDGVGKSCTKGVDLYINDRLRGSSFRLSGDGAGALLGSIKSKERTWNAYNDGEYANYGGWPASKIRAMLNGEDEYTNKLMNGNPAVTDGSGYPVAGTDLCDASLSLFSCFPKELKGAIVPKEVISDTLYNDKYTLANTMTTYDRLWLFSVVESWEEGYSNENRPNEGRIYERQSRLGITADNPENNIAYNEEGSACTRWTRSLRNYVKNYCFNISQSGEISVNKLDSANAVSPGFCLR